MQCANNNNDKCKEHSRCRGKTTGGSWTVLDPEIQKICLFAISRGIAPGAQKFNMNLRDKTFRPRYKKLNFVRIELISEDLTDIGNMANFASEIERFCLTASKGKDIHHHT